MYKSRLYIGVRLWPSFLAQIFQNRAKIGRIGETCTQKCRSANDFLYKSDLYEDHLGIGYREVGKRQVYQEHFPLDYP